MRLLIIWTLPVNAPLPQRMGWGGGGEGELKNLESAPNNHPKNQYHILDVKTDCSICLPTLVMGLLGQNVPIITI